MPGNNQSILNVHQDTHDLQWNEHDLHDTVDAFADEATSWGSSIGRGTISCSLMHRGCSWRREGNFRGLQLTDIHDKLHAQRPVHRLVPGKCWYAKTVNE